MTGFENDNMFYSRDEIVAAVTSYYEFLCCTLYEPSDLKVPPPGGWPSITTKSMKNLNKIPEIVDLLRHLPYIDREYQVIPETFCVDYTSDSIQGLIARNDLEWAVQPNVEHPGMPCPRAYVPEDCICLMFGRRHAYSVILDVTHGTVIWYNNDANWDGESHDLGRVIDEDDPRRPDAAEVLWRWEPTYDLDYFFRVFLRKRITDMHWILRDNWEITETNPRWPADEHDTALRKALTDAGFPGDGNGGGFDREKWLASPCHEW